MKNSKVHVYTGDGKGKTTCAFGLAVRCAGEGFSVNIIQFLKTAESGEVFLINNYLKNIKVYRFEKAHGFTFELCESEKKSLMCDIKKAVEFAKELLDKCDLLVLDEIIGAYGCGFVSKEDIKYIIENRGKTEIVLTGRDAPDWLLDAAHYVTNMQKIKHPFDDGCDARKGIEF